MGQRNSSFQFDPNKPLQIGGQAVIEGVMMRAPGRIATAVRRANGEIIVQERTHTSWSDLYTVLRLPVLRGAVGLIEMMKIGVETLNFSAEVIVSDLEAEERKNGNGSAKHSKKSERTWRLALSLLIAFVVGIGIFFAVPLLIATNLFQVDQNAVLFNGIAGGIRIFILIGYLVAIASLPDVNRLFGYHGAEHMAVFAFEAGAMLSVGEAGRYPRFHPRCGTSFILIVMLVAMVLFTIVDALLISVLGSISLPLRMMTHLPLIPLVGGISYEAIRCSARRSATPLGRILVAPGLWLQRITTREPNSSQLEVALVALRVALGKNQEQEIRTVHHPSELEAQ